MKHNYDYDRNEKQQKSRGQKTNSHSTNANQEGISKYTTLDRFSIECHKTQTKVITTANHRSEVRKVP